MESRTFVLVWRGGGWWRWAPFKAGASPTWGPAFAQDKSQSLGLNRKDTPVEQLRARAAEKAGVSPEAVAVLGYEGVEHG